MIGAKQFADRHGLSKAAVTRWCRLGLIHGAYLQDNLGVAQWVIPADSPKPQITYGRPKKAKPTPAKKSGKRSKE